MRTIGRRLPMRRRSSRVKAEQHRETMAKTLREVTAELVERGLVLDIRGDLNVPVRDVVYDSRRIRRGDLFIALRGTKSDGHRFTVDAVVAGAGSLLVEEFADVAVPQVRVKDTLEAMSAVAANCYDYPARSLLVLAVSGSNGKTTTTYLWESMLKAAGRTPAVLGTIEYRWGGQARGTGTTTPLSADLQRYLREMVNNGIDAVALEASSHGIELHRVDHLEPAVACFTNLSPEHLDFHLTMEAYGRAKKRLYAELLPEGRAAVLNAEDPYSAEIAQAITNRRIVRYGQVAEADVRAESVRHTLAGTAFTLVSPEGTAEIETSLIGHYNISNILGAAASALAAGLPMDAVARGIRELKCVPGRMEPVDEGQDFRVLVDYAHTPDGVEKVLDALKGVPHRHIITVVGCGGDRDRTKRPKMARIAADRSDTLILTSDNPRSEEPREIIRDMEGGLEDHGIRYEVIVDRTEAILQAIRHAGSDDIVLLLGKGHETYQILRDRTIAFDDREVARRALRERAGV